MNHGAHFVHQALLDELRRYLESQYLGKSPLLLEACEPLLGQEGKLYTQPFIESSAAYRKRVEGFQTADLQDELRRFFLSLVDADLGLYHDPYEHQIEALERAVRGEDLLVATGTGSGKTECFIWPILAKLEQEASMHPATWNGQRGVRVVMMYPMNALVSDQIGRLRRLLGDSEGRFLTAFRQVTGADIRRPQFGMYTGRTPYPGQQKTSQDKDLAKSLAAMLGDEENPYYMQMKKSGKIPAKVDLPSFITGLRLGQHHTNPEDAELITRIEMQTICPDILITNYSMLEYMLFRPAERDQIWSATKRWLAENPKEKLLFVIDEAHMYHGASGGEVALLLRRLFYTLGIDRTRVQFILTTASMPHDTDEDKQAVSKFACELTSADDNLFRDCIFGQNTVLSSTVQRPLSAAQLLSLDLRAMDASDEKRLSTLNDWLVQIAPEFHHCDTLPTLYQWLYAHLTDFIPFAELMRACQGNAVAISELAKRLFPSEAPEIALSATDVTLAVAPLAKAQDESVLFPVRMHMLFRGFQSICACTNPNCSDGHHRDGLSLGRVLLDDSGTTCPSCQSQVYELCNDRRCGALFFRGFIESDANSLNGRKYLWTQPGAFFDWQRMHEILLYIPSENERVLPKKKSTTYPISECWLDCASGYLDFDVDHVGEDGYRRLFYSNYVDKGRPQIISFASCPKCNQQFSGAKISTFTVRGNEAFYNVIKEQFNLQPPVHFETAGQHRFPNQGRKVLLFSDSRQRAATLARDLSDASDEAATRQLFMLALQKMHQLDDAEYPQLSLNDFYAYFLEAATHEHLTLFSGVSRDEFAKMATKLDTDHIRHPREPLHKFIQTTDAPKQMDEHLLRLFCGRYNTLCDAGLSYLAPMPRELEDAVDDLQKSGVQVTEREFEEVFFAVSRVFLRQFTALGPEICSAERERAIRQGREFGVDTTALLPKVITAVLGLTQDKQTQLIWVKAIETFMGRGRDDETKTFFDMRKVRPVFAINDSWYRCGHCGALSPILLRGVCPVCGSGQIAPADDFQPESFWRRGSERALLGERVQVIDTEEHTAQLGHKDQRDEFWSRTEQYEMRFQDIIAEDETPVDILSSTTTMEVGIDIGSLVAVGLRNMPPMRENYQQRAGRAGRRGASLSTIVTFVGDGPHDAHYFKDPTPMFRGNPRRPWIDVENDKLLRRHINMIFINAYMSSIGASLDSLPTLDFIANYKATLIPFLHRFTLCTELLSMLTHWKNADKLNECKSDFLAKIEKLKYKTEEHPELYQTDSGQSKMLLDALYEEAVIPTYSFPKNVVSTYIEDSDGRIRYQVERGLDVALGEYAPGRSIVVDKKTYQIGGLYLHGGHGLRNTTKRFYEDDSYRKTVVKCSDCGWFGYPEDMPNNHCPFCNGTTVQTLPPMVRPWGFSPVRGRELPTTLIDAQSTYTETPLYSTQPSGDMELVPGCAHLRIAKRSDQRIILLNQGAKSASGYDGFMLCKKCGATFPGSEQKVLKPVPTPGGKSFGCRHEDSVNITLGYDFLTDMLVAEIALPIDQIEVDTADAKLWLRRAGTTLAEAFHLTASRMLDVEESDIRAGHRIRTGDKAWFVDIYLYDSLSSGAGYCASLSDRFMELIEETTQFLDCSCPNACHQCLKNYKNQAIQGDLDRVAALELLEWMEKGILPPMPDIGLVRDELGKLSHVLAADNIHVQSMPNGLCSLIRGNNRVTMVIYNAMAHIPKNERQENTIYVTKEALKSARPFAVDTIEAALPPL